MNKYRIISLSVSGGLLSGIAWTDWCPGPVLLVSLVPFLLIGETIYTDRRRYTQLSLLKFLLPGFLIFSILTLSWMRVVSMVAAVLVVLTATVLMTFTFWLTHIVRIKAGTGAGVLSLMAFWLTLEFICLNSGILSPWISFGNGLAKEIRLIQWYELTGTAGGSLWIITSNVLVAGYITGRFRKIRGGSATYTALALVVFLLPPAVSLTRYHTLKPVMDGESEIVIVQPDYDPYTEKFTIPFDSQLENAIELAEPLVSPATRWVVFPETLVDDPVDESDLINNQYINRLREFAGHYPGINIVAGMVSYSPGNFVQSHTPDNLHAERPLQFKLYHNSAFRIDSGKSVEIYHKSKLVPGFETDISVTPLKFISGFLPELGGTQKGYSGQDDRTNFSHQPQNEIIAPVICYESVYGEFVSRYVRNGAEAIFVITNDGWWKNTNGYRHHLRYSSLRAIETRRPVVRCANTGISGFIDIYGNLNRETGWYEPAAIKGNIIPETRITPYVRYGDILMKAAIASSVLIILMVFVFMPLRDRFK